MAEPITLSQAMAVPDILDQTRYAVYFGQIPGISSSKDLTLKCFSATIPGFSNEAFEAMLGGHTLNFRGRKIYANPMTLSFYEDSGSFSLTTLRTWHEFCVGTESGNSQGYINQYSKTVKMEVYDTTGAVSSEHFIYRMYPVDIAEVTLSSESSAPVQVQVQFRYTFMESSTHPTL